MTQITTNSKNISLGQFLADTEQTKKDLHDIAALYVNGQFYSCGDLCGLKDEASEYDQSHEIEIVQVVEV